jgi:DDE superfamily endonuclease
MKFLDMTSLTVEEFDQLVPSFEEAFQERMNEWRSDGKKRRGRRYTTYTNCPLPTPEDRLLFILVYLKTNVLQVVQGQLFDLPQNKANQWIHTLLPVLQTTLRRLGDAPARTNEQLAQRLKQSTMEASLAEPETPSTVPAEPMELSVLTIDSPPLFAMTAPSDASNVQKTKMNRKAIIAARKNATP